MSFRRRHNRAILALRRCRPVFFAPVDDNLEFQLTLHDLLRTDHILRSHRALTLPDMVSGFPDRNLPASVLPQFSSSDHLP